MNAGRRPLVSMLGDVLLWEKSASKFHGMSIENFVSARKIARFGRTGINAPRGLVVVSSSKYGQSVIRYLSHFTDCLKGFAELAQCVSRKFSLFYRLFRGFNLV